MFRNLLRSLARSAAARSTLLVFGLLLVALPFLGCGAEHSEEGAGWHCPMHPTYTSDKPGDCPICGMNLVPIQASPQASGERKLLYYRSPMDPSVRSDKPAQDSMGMDFIPVYEDEAQARDSTVPGRANLSLSPERLQVLGIRSEEIHHGPLARVMLTVGRVAVDERRLHHIHMKYDGYVEHLYVNFTGKFVKKGDALLALFSPELIATQQEYLVALRAQTQLGTSPIPSIARGGASLSEAAKERLPGRFLGCPEVNGTLQYNRSPNGQGGGYGNPSGRVDSYEHVWSARRVSNAFPVLFQFNSCSWSMRMPRRASSL